MIHHSMAVFQMLSIDQVQETIEMIGPSTAAVISIKRRIKAYSYTRVQMPKEA